jgi:hypothetical protein
MLTRIAERLQRVGLSFHVDSRFSVAASDQNGRKRDQHRRVEGGVGPIELSKARYRKQHPRARTLRPKLFVKSRPTMPRRQMVLNGASCRRMCLWRALDDEGKVLDLLVQERRNNKRL